MTEQALSPLLMMGAMFVVIYLFMIRPHQKKQKELEKKISMMEKGDKVITTGGIKGKIHRVTDTSVFVIVDDNSTKIEFMKAAISTVESKNQDSSTNGKESQKKENRGGET